jgi:hypothetical protein
MTELGPRPLQDTRKKERGWRAGAKTNGRCTANATRGCTWREAGRLKTKAGYGLGVDLNANAMASLEAGKARARSSRRVVIFANERHARAGSRVRASTPRCQSTVQHRQDTQTTTHISDIPGLYRGVGM